MLRRAALGLVLVAAACSTYGGSGGDSRADAAPPTDAAVDGPSSDATGGLATGSDAAGADGDAIAPSGGYVHDSVDAPAFATAQVTANVSAKAEALRVRLTVFTDQGCFYADGLDMTYGS